MIHRSLVILFDCVAELLGEEEMHRIRLLYAAVSACFLYSSTTLYIDIEWKSILSVKFDWMIDVCECIFTCLVHHELVGLF